MAQLPALPFFVTEVVWVQDCFISRKIEDLTLFYLAFTEFTICRTFIPYNCLSFSTAIKVFFFFQIFVCI